MTLKPNFTAWFVLQGMVAAMNSPEFRSQADEQTLRLYKVIAAAASSTRFVSRIIHAMPHALQYRIGEWVTNHGRLRHFYLRKREIQAQTRHLLDNESISQVVILGAGMDVLSLRLAPDYPAVKFIEIDTEESQQFKTTCFANCGIALPKNIELVAGDLRNPLQEIFSRAHSFNHAANTLWIAEGFLMYLPEPRVAGLLQEIKTLGRTNHVVFTTLCAEKVTSGFAYLLQKCFLKKEKSQLGWVIPYEDVSAFVQSLDYRMQWEVSSRTLNGGNKEMSESLHLAYFSGQ